MSWQLGVFMLLANSLSFFCGYGLGIAHCKRIIEQEYARAKAECFSRIDNHIDKLRTDLRVVRIDRMEDLVHGSREVKL